MKLTSKFPYPQILKVDRRMSCATADSAISNDGGSPPTGAGEIMLYGVRVVVDPMRKSISMNNLSEYEHPQDASNNNKEVSLAAGYSSADEAVPQNSGSHREREHERERKRGVPWIEEEHKLFLLRLKKVGNGADQGPSMHEIAGNEEKESSSPRMDIYTFQDAGFCSTSRKKQSP